MGSYDYDPEWGDYQEPLEDTPSIEDIAAVVDTAVAQRVAQHVQATQTQTSELSVLELELTRIG